jgi:DNA (cytosine-5)-methyltransferase 1
MTLTITDLFCGAGGSSSGAEQVPGVRVRMAANHWKLAVKTHNTNLPHADHDVADISQVDPRRYPRTDILWASPECTNHSQAKGRKRAVDNTPDLFDQQLPDEAAERSRATMWDVPRFAEHHRYRAVVVENVVDAAKWVMWPAWLHAMDCLGYEHEVVYLNSMHAQQMGAPAPQSRDRLYVVFWRSGDRRPDLQRWTRPTAWCATCEELVSAVQSWKRLDRPWGRYRQQYVWRCPSSSCRFSVVEPGYLPAAAAIDWTLAGQRIGDRSKPLADKTRRRIAAGLAKYARPLHIEAAGNTYDGATTGSRYFRAWPLDQVLATMHTTQSKALAYPPLVVPVEGREGKQASPVDEPLRTQTARNESGVCVPPFIAELRGGGSETRPIDEALATITAAGNHHGLVSPPAFVMRNNTGGAEMCTPVDEELRTLTTKGHQSLIQWAALYGYDSGALRSLADVLPTQTTVEGDALLTGDIPDVDDCFFRMLEPHEIQAGMAFTGDYIVLGNKREKVRLLGNAVTPPAARDLIAAVAEALA